MSAKPGSIPLHYWYMYILFPHLAEIIFCQTNFLTIIIREKKEDKVDFGILKIKYCIQKSGTYERDAEFQQFICELKIIYLHVFFKIQ